jgi:hypothetical protein
MMNSPFVGRSSVMWSNGDAIRIALEKPRFNKELRAIRLEEAQGGGTNPDTV